MSAACTGAFDGGSTVTQIQQTDGTIVTTTTNVNTGDTHDYYDGAVKHKQADSRKIASMTASVMSAESCLDCTDSGRAWADAFKMLVVGWGENFKSEPYTAEMATNGWDVTESIVNGVVKVSTGGIFTYGDLRLGAGSSSNFGEGVRIEMGDGGSILGSFTEQTSTTTATTGEGDPNAVTNPTAGDSDNSSEDNDSDSTVN